MIIRVVGSKQKLQPAAKRSVRSSFEGEAWTRKYIVNRIALNLHAIPFLPPGEGGKRRELSNLGLAGFSRLSQERDMRLENQFVRERHAATQRCLQALHGRLVRDRKSTRLNSSH